jgi:hypothetical protein
MLLSDQVLATGETPVPPATQASVHRIACLREVVVAIGTDDRYTNRS